MALGAQRTDVTSLVLRKAGFLLGSGLALGWACTWIATRTIKAFLFGVDAHDPATILSVCALLAVCGFMAALIPRGAPRRSIPCRRGGQNKRIVPISAPQRDAQKIPTDNGALTAG